MSRSNKILAVCNRQACRVGIQNDNIQFELDEDVPSSGPGGDGAGVSWGMISSPSPSGKSKKNHQGRLTKPNETEMVHGTWYMVHGTWYMVHG